jgi:hypothetical protein
LSSSSPHEVCDAVSCRLKDVPRIVFSGQYVHECTQHLVLEDRLRRTEYVLAEHEADKLFLCGRHVFKEVDDVLQSRRAGRSACKLLFRNMRRAKPNLATFVALQEIFEGVHLLRR